jgi:hypothetical protein
MLSGDEVWAAIVMKARQRHPELEVGFLVLLVSSIRHGMCCSPSVARNAAFVSHVLGGVWPRCTTMSLSPFDNIWGCVQKFALEHHLAIIVKGPSSEVQAQLCAAFDV